MTVGIEGHWVQVDSASAFLNQLDAHWSAIGLDDVPALLQHLDGATLILRIQGEVEVSMQSRWLADEGVDAPASADPAPATGHVECCEHIEDLAQ